MSQGSITASIAERLKAIVEKSRRGESITDSDIIILYLDFITVEIKELKEKVDSLEKELQKIKQN
ncbi:MAG TPA: hypothetical protein VKU94_02425 [Geobacterales bacterium]|nr:hypothetical protein [Geobacterales bacterium]